MAQVTKPLLPWDRHLRIRDEIIKDARRERKADLAGRDTWDCSGDEAIPSLGQYIWEAEERFWKCPQAPDHSTADKERVSDLLKEWIEKISNAPCRTLEGALLKSELDFEY